MTIRHRWPRNEYSKKYFIKWFSIFALYSIYYAERGFCKKYPRIDSRRVHFLHITFVIIYAYKMFKFNAPITATTVLFHTTLTEVPWFTIVPSINEEFTRVTIISYTSQVTSLTLHVSLRKSTFSSLNSCSHSLSHYLYFSIPSREI